MSAVGENVTLRMAYNGVPFFCVEGMSKNIPINRISVQVGKKENYSDTYFVDFGKLRDGSAHIQFTFDKTKQVSDAISIPFKAVQDIFVRLEGKVITTTFTSLATSEPVEFTPGGAHHIFIENVTGKPIVTYPDSKEMISDD